MARTRIALALVALAAGILVAGIVAREGSEGMLEALLGLAIGWSFVASGLVAWERRPENAIGRLMVVAGFLRLGGELCTGSDDRLLYPLGHLLHDGFWVAVAAVLLAFPTGRLEDALSRFALAAGGALVAVDLGWLLLGGDHARNGLALAGPSDWTRGFRAVATGLTLVLVPLVIVILARRWSRASPPVRRAVAPVVWAGAAGFAVLLVTYADDLLGNPLGDVSMALVDLTVAGVAIGFLAGLLRARLARSSVAELVVELGGLAAPGDLRDALARALHDPSLALAYWLPDRQGYVDVDGRPVEVPAGSGPRAVSLVARDGATIAALVHDPVLADDADLVESVCAAAALALENERLQAELRARVEELRASRARLVEAADEERRRIERNLHDGTQQRLVSVSMALGLAEAKLRSDPATALAVVDEARQGLSAALEELRELSHGIHPGILTERGLAAALDALTLRAAVPVDLVAVVGGGRRLPEPVEAAAYYVVSEALANVAKHAHATSARVRVDRVGGELLVEVADDGIGGADTARGSGLRGLTDRVEAIGGRLWLSSPPGQGTVLRAELPCA